MTVYHSDTVQCEWVMAEVRFGFNFLFGIFELQKDKCVIEKKRLVIFQFPLVSFHSFCLAGRQ